MTSNRSLPVQRPVGDKEIYELGETESLPLFATFSPVKMVELAQACTNKLYL